jgi:Mg-chelatase subunit ChlD
VGTDCRELRDTDVVLRPDSCTFANAVHSDKIALSITIFDTPSMLGVSLCSATMFLMRTTARWAFWRRTQYFAFFAMVLMLLSALFYMKVLYTAPTCTDGKQNGDELGIDCGGGCTKICAFEAVAPIVDWTRSFRITDGQYNAVAYVENRNKVAATPELHYTFSLYDDQGLITERSGTTVLPPDSVYPIFEGRIATNGRVPTRTFLDIEDPAEWLPATYGRDQFTVLERTLTGADSAPRLSATIRNNDLLEAQQVEVIATIFDKSRNALTSSRTIVDHFAPRSDTNVIFTWPEPIAKTVRSCEVPTDVVVAIDLSGSMNDDGGTPPEPVSSVFTAAKSFIGRLKEGDQVGLVTFATNATAVASLSGDRVGAAATVAGLAIAPKEETGATNTGEAFMRASDLFASAAHNPNARKVLVILTDGKATAPNEDPEVFALTAASSTKAAGIEVYAIGLGANVNYDFVKALASDDAHAYQVLQTADIDRIYQNITSAICEDGPAIIEIIPKTAASFETL